jgi:hypothetical protein
VVNRVEERRPEYGGRVHRIRRDVKHQPLTDLSTLGTLSNGTSRPHPARA